MTVLHLPSVQVDAVAEDVLDAARACLPGTNDGTFDLGTGGSFAISTDGGGVETINLYDAQFADMSQATATEVAAAINSQLTGGVAVANGARVDLYSNTYGAASFVQVLVAVFPAHTIFGWSLAIQSGTDAGAQFVVYNREPAPDERSFALDRPLYFELGYVGAFPVPTDVELRVDGVLAWSSGGGWQNGWSGTVATPHARIQQFTATPPSNWTEGATVTCLVESATVGLAETWSFRAYDESPPLIASVQARGVRLLRVTFNEPVRMESASAATDALNPANYRFDRQSRPAVEVEAVSVARVGDSTVDVTTDIELTFGAPYLLQVANVVDLEGNAFLPPNNDATFDAYSPLYPTGRRFRIDEYVPAMNRAEDTTGELQLTLAVVQEVLNLLLYGIDNWTDILDVDEAPERYLDALLTGLGNPFDRFVLSVADKRRLIRLLVAIYKLKGTARGIVDVVRFFLGVDVVIETFNGEGWEIGDGDKPDVDVLGAGHAALVGDELNGAGRAARARLVGTTREFFDLGTGGTFTITVNGVPNAISFTALDFNDLNNARASEVATALNAQLTGATAVEVSWRVDLLTDLSGAGATLQLTDGTLAASTIFGWQTATVSGHDGASAIVEAPVSPAILGPPRSGIYSFRVLASGTLTEEQRTRIAEIAEYMKPAHTHLLAVLDDTPPEEVDHLELGISELGSRAPGGAPGTFILHGPP